MRRATSFGAEAPTGTATAYAGWRGFAALETWSATRPREFEDLDERRLFVERRFAALLRQNGIATFEALLDIRGGLCVRRIKNRSTTRIALYDRSGYRWFYLKRHERPHWVERLRPLLNFGRPVFGARNEWLAILGLREAGIRR